MKTQQPTTIILDGNWEKNGRNPLFAAFILVFLCGTVYFFIPSFIISLFQLIENVSIKLLGNNDTALQERKNYLELLKYVYEKYKYIVLVATNIGQYLFLFGLSLFFISKWHTRQIRAYIKADRFNILHILFAVTGAVLIIPLVNYISEFSYRFFPVFKKLSEATAPLFTAKTIPDWILILFTYTITPALCEETLFRGYFQRTLERKLAFPWHFILAGFLFALYHQQLLSLPALFLVGIYLGFVFYSFNSLYVSMAAHSCYNLLIILLNNFPAYPDFLFSGNGGFTLPVTLGALFLFILINIFIFLSGKQQMLHSETNFSYPGQP